MTVLALDAGNSAVKASRWDGEAWGEVLRWPTAARVPDALADLTGAVEASGLASVVPAHTERLADVLTRATGRPPVVVSAAARLPFAMRYATPQTLGADRLAAAVAAWAGWGGDRPVVALDAGTAVTLDVVAPGTDGPVYLGGSIAPGPDLLRRALTRGTGQLPAAVFDAPPSVIGTSTDEALRAGLTATFAEGVAGLLARTADALRAGGHAQPLVVATGGWAPWLVGEGVAVDAVAPMLVLDGVRWFVEDACR